MRGMPRGVVASRVSFMLRLIVGGVFIYASLDKIAFPVDFARIVRNYGILPPQMAEMFAFLLPWLELGLGILMIVGLFLRPTAALLSLILMVFIAAIVFKSLNGTLENCGCFSTSAEAEKQSPAILVMRNLLLIFGCLFLFLNKTSRSAKVEWGQNDDDQRKNSR